MNALRTLGFGLVLGGAMLPAVSTFAQCPVQQPQVAAAPAQVPAQVTQRRAYSYEPALVAPARVYAPTYYRGGSHGYNRTPWLTTKTLR